MNVKDIMTRTVATLNGNDTVEQAAKLMKEHNVGAIPVCEGEKVIGIITDRDIAIRSVGEGQNVTNQSVREIMSSNPVFAKEDMDIHEAARIMSERQIRRLPVVENNNLIGIVSIGDIAVQPKLHDDIGETLSSISEPGSNE